MTIKRVTLMTIFLDDNNMFGGFGIIARGEAAVVARKF
jgi:hypothetical protein